MSERIVLHKNNRFEMSLWSQDEESGKLTPVNISHALNAYGLLLAGLGSCTTDILLVYAMNHGLDLKEVQVELDYERDYKKDCENCEKVKEYREQITMELRFLGNLAAEQKQKLFQISRLCPIHKMLKSGIEVRSEMKKE